MQLVESANAKEFLSKCPITITLSVEYKKIILFVFCCDLSTVCKLNDILVILSYNKFFKIFLR